MSQVGLSLSFFLSLSLHSRIFSKYINQPLLMVVSLPRKTSLLFLYIYLSTIQDKYHLFQEVFSQAKLDIPLLCSHSMPCFPLIWHFPSYIKSICLLLSLILECIIVSNIRKQCIPAIALAPWCTEDIAVNKIQKVLASLTFFEIMDE